MKIDGVVAEFVQYWGGVGSRWGVEEDTARILSFLYVEEDPYNVGELTKALGMSRPKVKAALETLVAWETVEVVEVEGAKGDYFMCEYEPWDLIWRLTLQRGEAELAAAIPWMADMVARAEQASGLADYAAGRIKEADRFTRLVERGLADIKRMPSLHLASVTQLGGRVVKFLGLS